VSPPIWICSRCASVAADRDCAFGFSVWLAYACGTQAEVFEVESKFFERIVAAKLANNAWIVRVPIIPGWQSSHPIRKDRAYKGRPEIMISSAAQIVEEGALDRSAPGYCASRTPITPPKRHGSCASAAMVPQRPAMRRRFNDEPGSRWESNCPLNRSTRAITYRRWRPRSFPQSRRRAPRWPTTASSIARRPHK
jgi:hypothetical protein